MSQWWNRRQSIKISHNNHRHNHVTRARSHIPSYSIEHTTGLKVTPELDLGPEWFNQLDDKYEWRTRILVCGYCRLIQSYTNYQYETPWIISKLVIEYFHFNIYDKNLGFTDHRATNIWLVSYLNEDIIHLANPHAMHSILVTIFNEITGCTESENAFPIKIYNILSRKADPYITSNDFHIFYEWFIGICYIIKDLLPYYKKAISIQLSGDEDITIKSCLNYLFENEKTTLSHDELYRGGVTFTFRVSIFTNSCLYIAFNEQYYALKRLLNGSYGSINENQLSKHEQSTSKSHHTVNSNIHNQQQKEWIIKSLYYQWPQGQFYKSIDALIKPWQDLKYFLIHKHVHVYKNKICNSSQQQQQRANINPFLQQVHVDDVDVADNYASIDTVDNNYAYIDINQPQFQNAIFQSSLNQSTPLLNNSTDNIYADFRVSDIMKLGLKSTESKPIQRQSQSQRMNLQDFQSKMVMTLENTESKSIKPAKLPLWLRDIVGYDRRSKMIICGYYRIFCCSYSEYKHKPTILNIDIIRLSLSYFDFNIYDIGITDKNAMQIWLESYQVNNKFIAILNDLSKVLLHRFKSIIRSSDFEPNINDISQFFKKYKMNDEIQDDKDKDDIRLWKIHATKFNKFYVWCRGICHIMKDLKFIKDNIGIYPYLFNSRKSAENRLRSEINDGSFILRVSSNINGLGITYKHNNRNSNKIMHVLLTRQENTENKELSVYKIGSSMTNTEMTMNEFILNFSDLKYFVHKSQSYDKEKVFRLVTKEKHNTNDLISDDIIYLERVYESLMSDFRRISKCRDKDKQPNLHEIEPFCIKKGGKYRDKNNNHKQKHVCITIEKYKRFLSWFEAMSHIINDIGDNTYYNYLRKQLFYDRKCVETVLNDKPIGTFIVRVSAKENGLVISYKNINNKILHTLLTRIGNKSYVVGSAKEGHELSQIILVWSELNCLYHPTTQKLIKKESAFSLYIN